MDHWLSSLARPFLFCLIALALTSCTERSIPNVNSGRTTSSSTDSRPKDYPPLPSALSDAEFELLDGTKFRLSDKKGKVIMVNLWGTWCGPCRQEMPHLVEMQDKHGSQGFEVIGLNIGDNSGVPEPTDWIKSFAEKLKVNYTLARSSNSTTAYFYQISKQQVVPQTFLVDREGHLRGVFIGGGQRVFDSMKTTLEKTLNEG